MSDRPWGITLAALALDRRTGQLTLREEPRAPIGGTRPPPSHTFRIAFFRGSIVSASSPIAADAALRIAVTSKLVTAAQAAELKPRLKLLGQDVRRNGRLPTAVEPDEVAVIAETLRWPRDMTESLRDAVIARCAARTFAVDRGRYILEDRIEHATPEGRADVRSVVYQGVRMHLSDQRLAFDLRQLGAWFVLKPRITDELAGFGFTDVERPIVEALRAGTNVAAFEAQNREIDPRTVQAVIYALAACDAVVCCEAPAIARAASQPIRAATAMDTEPRGVPTLADYQITPQRPPAEDDDFDSPIICARGTRETPPLGAPIVLGPAGDRGYVQRDMPRSEPVLLGPAGGPANVDPRAPTVAIETNKSGFVDMRTTTVRPNALAAHEVKALIVARATLLDLGADHFTLLGLPPGATPDEVRAAYVELARYLEPKRLAALGIPDDSYTARRLFAQICIAVTTLTDPVRRREYVASLGS